MKCEAVAQNIILIRGLSLIAGSLHWLYVNLMQYFHKEERISL